MMPTFDTGLGWIEPDPEQISGERRRRGRFDIRLPLRYRVAGRGRTLQGSAVTVNMSSGGVAFECAQEMPAGAQIELSIEWPVALHGTVGLTLEAKGHVCWQTDGVVAVLIKKSALHTQSRAARSAGSSF